MDEKSPAKLGLKDHMLVFASLEKTYGRECAFDIATRSADPMLKLVAVAPADQHAAQVLMRDLHTLRDKKDGAPEHNALRWGAA
jgi:hypothetical protein